MRSEFGGMQVDTKPFQKQLASARKSLRKFQREVRRGLHQTHGENKMIRTDKVAKK